MTIQLCSGPGSLESKSACWGSAINAWQLDSEGKSVTRSNWSDEPSCVSPVITALCQSLNDMLPDDRRWEVISPHFETPIGTRTDDRATEQRRMFRCVDMAVRVWAPRALDAAGLYKHAQQLRALAPVVDKRTNWAAEVAAKAVRDAAGIAYVTGATSGSSGVTRMVYGAALNTASYTVNAVSNASHAAISAVDAVVDAVSNATHAATRGIKADGDPIRIGFEQELLDLILELCAYTEVKERPSANEIVGATQKAFSATETGTKSL